LAGGLAGGFGSESMSEAPVKSPAGGPGLLNEAGALGLDAANLD